MRLVYCFNASYILCHICLPYDVKSEHDDIVSFQCRELEQEIARDESYDVSSENEAYANVL